MIEQAKRILTQLVNDRKAWRANKITTTDYEIAIRHNIDDAERLLKEAPQSGLTDAQQRVAIGLLREWHTGARNKAALNHETANFLRSLAE